MSVKQQENAEELTPFEELNLRIWNALPAEMTTGAPTTAEREHDGNGRGQRLHEVVQRCSVEAAAQEARASASMGPWNGHREQAITACRHIAMYRASEGDFKQAVEFMEQSLTLCLEAHGSAHTDTLTAQALLKELKQAGVDNVVGLPGKVSE